MGKLRDVPGDTQCPTAGEEGATRLTIASTQALGGRRDRVLNFASSGKELGRVGSPHLLQ
jgi:hypothetical protein